MVEVGMAGGAGELLSYHGHQGAVMKGSDLQFLRPWMESPFVKGHSDLDRLRNPAVCPRGVLPGIVAIFVTRDRPLTFTQLCINTPPVCPRDVLRLKIRVSDDFDEVLKA